MPSDTEIKRFVADKLNAGIKLGDIQKLLEHELNVPMTYLDLRLLASELEEVDWEKQEPPAPPADEEVDLSAVEEEKTAPPSDTVQVTVSKLARPDAAMSGNYECPSGAKGEWMIDNFGRPGLIPAPDSPKPTAEEMRQFQEALVNKLQNR